MADSYKLVSTASDQSFDVKPGVALVVGRAVNSDIPIYDPTISRQHAQLSAEDGGVRVKDLGSSNGTFLNGSRITNALAAPNDVITFGKVAFYVRETAKPATKPQDAEGGFAAPKSAGATIVRQLPVRESGPAIESPLKRLSVATLPPAAEAVAEPTARSAKKLALLLEISKQLSRQLEVDKLLESVVDFTFQVMDVDRCSILLCEKGSGDLVPRISKSRLGEGSASARHVPQSIARKAVSERVAILTDNAAEDERFKGKSILLQSVRSAMGAPLMASDGSVLGLIYVDNLTATHAFRDEDLEFLIAFSGVASVAMENSQLSDRIRREALVLSNFQRYFSPDLAKQIADHGEEMKLDMGSKREVVIMFTDIRGFTPMSEKMAPEDVAHLLREYFTEMVEIVFRNGGTLDKFIGDAIMALWGAPVATPNDADKAMTAAIEMQRALVQLNEHWTGGGKPSINIGIGINFGEVFAGNIGSEQRLEYTVLGDAVNTASRLCSKADKGEIMISEPFYKRLKEPPQVEAREPIPLKGKSKPVANYLAKY
jgi:adenylate cyclase